MNYQHLYHAGNFADVLKHVVLISLIESLKQKEKPFCYIETHAGSGLYNLNSIEANKTQEYKEGVSRLFEQGDLSKPIPQEKSILNIPAVIKNYLSIVIENGFPDTYPGSPLIAQHCLRAEDSMILMELHSEEAKALKALFQPKKIQANKTQDEKREENIIQRNKNIAVHQQDGYLGLKAFLPPKERRALILIDPPFEKANEWKAIISSLALSLKRFPSGVYAIWYPLKDKKAVAEFKKQLTLLMHPKGPNEHNEVILGVELTVHPEDIEFGLVGCGMAIINPPWQWKESITQVIPWIWERLAIEGKGGYRISEIS